MHRTLAICGIAATLGATFGIVPTATAQRMEITSQSIGTVVMTPPPINPNGPAPAATAPTGRGNGVDLGIRRNRDGSLYDALDPAQNPAAAPAPDAAAANAQANGNVAVPTTPLPGTANSGAPARAPAAPAGSSTRRM